MAFQLVDDVLDYEGNDADKTLLADLVEGKATLPLVLAIRENSAIEPLVRRIHAGDREPVEAVRDAVIASGACTEVRKRAARLTDDALRALRSVPEGSARRMLEDVALRLVGRER
jgi:geranylgeranyl pyrophosphate synthase